MLAKANPPTRHQGHVRVPVYSSPTGTTYSWETAGARTRHTFRHWAVDAGRS
jgi:hypothetical protein